jgi:type I restriction enzyme M protein
LLIDPQHWDDEPFEAIVSNPPYSIAWEGDANPLLINDPRYAPAGVLAPKSKADLAFTMHMLSWLAVDGTAAIVEFPGVLYRGGAEQKIRKYPIDNNYVRHGDPAAARPLLRHHHRHVHHRAQEIQKG